MTVLGANPVDIVVLIVVLVSALLALVRGFVAEVLAILGWVAASFAALYGMKPLLPVVEGYTGPGTTAAAVTAGALFFGTLLLMSALSYAVSRAMRTHHLSAVDRSLGFLFGLGRGGLLVCLLYICVTFIFPLPKQGEEVDPHSMQAVVLEARTQPALEAASAALISLAPDRNLSVEDLTKNPLTTLLQPKDQPSGTTTPPPPGPDAGYARAAREGLANMIDRVETDPPASATPDAPLQPAEARPTGVMPEPLPPPAPVAAPPAPRR